MPEQIGRTQPDRREEIVAVALRVFSTHGFGGATNQLVAKEAGVKSAGLIYHYFASKEDLLRAVAASGGTADALDCADAYGEKTSAPRTSAGSSAFASGCMVCSCRSSGERGKPV